MDTVCKLPLPFELQLIKTYPKRVPIKGEFFYFDEHKLWEEDKCTFSAEENDEIEILFNSNDSNARLYLEALDIMPLNDKNIMYDEKGHIYRIPSENSFVLYKSDSEHDALRIDVFKISVFCEGQWYYGTFEILPKPMSEDEWRMMRDDLEKEINGLSQDIVRKNIGIGQNSSNDMPPKVFYEFLVIKKFSQKVLMALMDISEKPRSEIKTEYINVSKNKSSKCQFDAETMKQYVMRSGSDSTYKIPIKSIKYDIQDNRLLKMIIEEYESKLESFIKRIESSEKYTKLHNLSETKQYKLTWIKTLTDFKEMALKLKNMTAVLKTQNWYSEILRIKEPYIPHSFIMDARYNVLYQMYLELKKEKMHTELDPEFSYTWKRSSYLYEMWCYFRICRILLKKYEGDMEEWKYIFSDKVLFPFLEEGTKLNFENENIRLELIYEKVFPLDEKQTSKENPLYIAKHNSEYKLHNKPDMVIHVYDKKTDWYLGSIVLECKYRKLYSFWNKDSQRSSRGQFEAYYNDARSIFLLGGYEDELHPVTKIFVLTPDILGDGNEQKDFNILVKGFKPSVDDVYTLEHELFKELKKLEKRRERIKWFLS